MSRRARLPGAAELFRATAAVEPAWEAIPGAHSGAGAVAGPAEPHALVRPHVAPSPAPRALRSARRMPARADRLPTGRERHDEKITVYCSQDELLDLETARLRLRAEHGIAVDRGRIVREAVAVVLADLDANGESSILVRRLREL